MTLLDALIIFWFGGYCIVFTVSLVYPPQTKTKAPFLFILLLNFVLPLASWILIIIKIYKQVQYRNMPEKDLGKLIEELLSKVGQQSES